MKDLNTGENYYLCYCLEGTVKSFEDDICYLPENDEITKLINIQRNTQCYKADGKTHNYCHNNENSNQCYQNCPRDYPYKSEEELKCYSNCLESGINKYTLIADIEKTE